MSNGRFYIVTNIVDPITGEQIKVKMHHMVMGCPLNGLMLDHKDGCSANNCRFNLRICTNSQNQWNTKGRRGATSRFKGVSWSKRYSKWRVALMVNGRTHFGGYFGDETEAARRYNALAVQLQSKFAWLNDA